MILVFVLSFGPFKMRQTLFCSWILYEKADFQGRSIALEEGGIELTNVWAETEQEAEPADGRPMLIGSIRLAVSVSGPTQSPLTSTTQT